MLLLDLDQMKNPGDPTNLETDPVTINMDNVLFFTNQFITFVDGSGMVVKQSMDDIKALIFESEGHGGPVV